MAKLRIRFASGLTGHANLPFSRPLYIGTSPECDIALDDKAVAPVHCRIVRQENRFYVHSEAESSGVFLNGKHVTSAPLSDGDVLQLGRCEILVSLEDRWPR